MKRQLSTLLSLRDIWNKKYIISSSYVIFVVLIIYITYYFKFLPDFIWDIDLNKIYQYLDSLTLVQEGALLHIVVLITMLVTVFNILGAFFGNEIIKYFNIEERFPCLSNILKIRAKLQRYYFLWNIFILFILCIGALAINILVFITG